MNLSSTVGMNRERNADGRRYRMHYWVLALIVLSVLGLHDVAYAQNGNGDSPPNLEAINAPGANGIPRDSMTTTTLEFFCVDAYGNPVSGAGVTFSATYPGVITAPTAKETSGTDGGVVVTVKSADINAKTASTTVTASCGTNFSNSAKVSLYGLSISLVSSEPKIYQFNVAQQHTTATLTATVTDGQPGDQPLGTVQFVSPGGTLSPQSAALNPGTY